MISGVGVGYVRYPGGGVGGGSVISGVGSVGSDGSDGGGVVVVMVVAVASKAVLVVRLRSTADGCRHAPPD